MPQLPWFYPVLFGGALLLLILNLSVHLAARGKTQYKQGISGLRPDEKTAGETDPRSGQRLRYDHAGDNMQPHSHQLGPLLNVIRGRYLRHSTLALMVIGVGIAALYLLFVRQLPMFGDVNPLAGKLFGTFSSLLCFGYGLRLLWFSTRRIKLRRWGLEVCSLGKATPYEYRDIDLLLDRRVAHRNESDTYRPIGAKASDTYFWIWECLVIPKQGGKPVELRSTHYSRLRWKAQHLQEHLVWEDANAPTTAN